MSVITESAFNTTLAQTLKSTGSDSIIKLGALPLSITSGRMKMDTGSNSEWVNFTGVDIPTTSLTGCTRGLKKNAASTTDALASNKKTHVVGTAVKLVYHSVDINKTAWTDGNNIFSGTNTFLGFVDIHGGRLRIPSFANTAARDAAIPAPQDGDVCVAAGDEYHYNGTTVQWEVNGTGTPTPNASETVTGKAREATATQTKDQIEDNSGRLFINPKETVQTPAIPIAELQLNESAGSISYNAVLGNDGIVTAGVTQTTGGAVFNGAAGRIYIPDYSNISNMWAGGGACSVFINPTNAGQAGRGQIFNKDDVGNDGWYLQVENLAAGFVQITFAQRFTGADGAWRTNAVVPVGSFTNVIVDYNSDNVANNPVISINGAPAAIVQIFVPAGVAKDDTGNNLVIGNWNGETLTFDGTIKQAKFWTQTLTFSRQVIDIAANPTYGGAAEEGKIPKLDFNLSLDSYTHPGINYTKTARYGEPFAQSSPAWLDPVTDRWFNADAAILSRGHLQYGLTIDSGTTGDSGKRVALPCSLVPVNPAVVAGLIDGDIFIKNAGGFSNTPGTYQTVFGMLLTGVLNSGLTVPYIYIYPRAQTDTQARTLIDGSEASLLHHHDDIINQVNNGRYFFQSTGTQSTAAGGTVTLHASGGELTTAGGGGDSAQDYIDTSFIYFTTPTINANPLWFASIALNQTVTQRGIFGFSDVVGGGASIGAGGTAIFNHAAFIFEDNTLWASTANGGVQTKSAVLAVAFTNSNRFYIKKTGTGYDFFINDFVTPVFSATLTLPTSIGTGLIRIQETAAAFKTIFYLNHKITRDF